ncbi:hypothetical protein D3C71_1858460 [compost metagenome]
MQTLNDFNGLPERQATVTTVATCVGHGQYTGWVTTSELHDVFIRQFAGFDFVVYAVHRNFHGVAL